MGSQNVFNLNQSLKARDYFAGRDEIELCRAIEWGNTKDIQKLLDKGLDAQIRGKTDDMTFLMWALLKQNKSSYQYLLEHGASPNLVSQYHSNKISVMNLAVMSGDVFWLKLALEYGGDPNTPSRQFSNKEANETIIFEAIRSYRIENVRLLIEAGADLNYQDKMWGNTPLCQAIISSKYDVAYMLLERGADPELNKEKIISVIDKTNVYSMRSQEEANRQAGWQKKVIEVLKSKGFAFARK